MNRVEFRNKILLAKYTPQFDCNNKNCWQRNFVKLQFVENIMFFNESFLYVIILRATVLEKRKLKTPKYYPYWFFFNPLEAQIGGELSSQNFT